MTTRKTLMASVACLSGLALAGCSGWSYSPPMAGNPQVEARNLASAQAEAPKGQSNFDGQLQGEYSRLATNLVTTPMITSPGDWVDADYFSRKSLKAESGAVVPPENNAHWLIPLEQPYGFRTQLANERARLVTALDDGGRDRAPALAARAQARYDCWVEEMERDWQTGMNGACHTEFLSALDELNGARASGTSAPPALRGYNVFFEFDKSSLTPEGRRVVDAAADALRSDAGLRIALVGKADLSGTDPYNLALSERRADTVRSVLLTRGITSDRVDERWVGEREPPVPTADGIREPRNRVVEVTLR